MATPRREPTELLRISHDLLKQVSETPPALDGGGFVGFGHTGVHVELTDVRIGQAVFDRLDNPADSYFKQIAEHGWDSLEVPPVDGYEFSILAHEVGHALIAASTPFGYLIDSSGEALARCWYALMDLCPRFDGTLASLLALEAQIQEGMFREDVELRHATLVMTRMLSTLLNAGIARQLARFNPLHFTVRDTEYEPKGNQSYLILENAHGSDALKIPLDYRLLSENLSYMLQQTVHSLFPASDSDVQGLDVRHYAIQLRPEFASYSILSNYVMRRTHDLPSWNGRLPEAILELCFSYGAQLPPGKGARLRPLALVLEAILDAVAEPMIPTLSLDSVNEFVEFVHQRLRSDDRLQGDFEIAEPTHQEMIARWAEVAAEQADPEFARIDVRAQRERAASLLQTRTQYPLLFHWMSFHPGVVLDMLVGVGANFYSPQLIVLIEENLSQPTGLCSGEFELAIVLDILFNRDPRCPSNARGTCHGVIFGTPCNDEVGPAASRHPCGFFNYRDVLLQHRLRSDSEHEVPLHNLLDLFALHREGDATVVVVPSGKDLGAAS